MKAKSALVFAAILFLLPVRSIEAQDLGPLFKKIKDGIYIYTGKPSEPNCTIILTQEGVVLIDSGNTPVDSQAVMKAVKQLTSQPIRFLINTEPHTDHTTGHFVFSPPAIIIAAAGAGESMRQAYNRFSGCQALQQSASFRQHSRYARRHQDDESHQPRGRDSGTRRSRHD
jgi:glyoxylase-like metal-dependent hydrolase (beta-lactamase superfamily II)